MRENPDWLLAPLSIDILAAMIVVHDQDRDL
ncbi:hypothetical protein CBM2586_B90243 [Cupriavidus phytorum]|uniref:Uncharacterized protein n=1 Tax=Cupriavidus taiwanensis TaxID=164546 RepID=A0A976FS41_9BURK|nr:hypothetical protein CBM2586_B90243 [Cupriavidus taiwanensis]